MSLRTTKDVQCLLSKQGNKFSLPHCSWVPEGKICTCFIPECPEWVPALAGVPKWVRMINGWSWWAVRPPGRGGTAQRTEAQLLLSTARDTLTDPRCPGDPQPISGSTEGTCLSQTPESLPLSSAVVWGCRWVSYRGAAL